MKASLLLLLLTLASIMACDSVSDAIDIDDNLTPNAVELSGFDMDLFRAECSLIQGNLIISPFSVSNVTKMILAAASGETEEEILKAYQNSSKDDLLQANKEIMAHLANLDSTTVNCVNTFYYDKEKIEALSAFEKVLQEYFEAEGQAINFSNKEAALKSINDWCSLNTQGRIPKILDNISDDEVMFLLNAIYLKASWAQPFVPEHTRDAPFTLSNGNTTTASFMYQDNSFNFGSYENAEMIELEYSDNELSLCLIKPKSGNLNEYISNFTQATFDSLYSSLAKKRYMFYLPKFSIEYENKNMQPTFALMGIKKMFSNQAELSLSNPSNTAISRIVHKTFFSIDEKGTEGAAVTAGGVVLTSMPPTFKLDEPFLFALRHQASEQVLFMGRIVNPNE